MAAALAPEVEAVAPALAAITPVSPATVAAAPSGQSVAGVPLGEHKRRKPKEKQKRRRETKRKQGCRKPCTLEAQAAVAPCDAWPFPVAAPAGVLAGPACNQQLLLPIHQHALCCLCHSIAVAACCSRQRLAHKHVRPCVTESPPASNSTCSCLRLHWWPTVIGTSDYLQWQPTVTEPAP